MTTQETKYIVICGNPSDGYDHTGPFDTHEDALEYVEHTHGADDDPVWIVHLQSPALKAGCVR